MSLESDIKEIVAKLPDAPGVYKYFNGDTIVYVGKAKNLKKRVSSYFNKNQISYKTQRLVSQITNIEFIVVSSERDALLLENNLIKNLQPRYNINLKDDKSYPYICVTRERFPRVFPIRRRVKALGTYFGPYTKVSDLRETLELVQRLYTIRTCRLSLSKENVESGKFKVCLEYHIHNCKGPCENLQTEEDYNEDIKQVMNILRGRISEARNMLIGKMNAWASKLEFEKAQQVKESLDKLEMFKSKSQVVSEKFKDLEVYSIISEEKIAYMNFIKVIEGRIIHSETKSVKKVLDETDEEILTFFINYIRIETQSEAEEVITNIAIEETEGLNLSIPDKGEKKDLLDLSLRNILEYKRHKIGKEQDDEEQTNTTLKLLQKDLSLKTLPLHIECFDNSNIQGTNPVAGMVCFKNGKPAKKEYRHFNIKTVVGPDDFSSMHEVVGRRYSRMIAENQALPDLIIIDGGKGQLGAAVDALKEVGAYGKVAVISVAKRLEELYTPGDEFPLHLDKKSPSLRLIQQIRDEVHNYAITFHRKQRSKNANISELESIKGISKETIKILYSEFKTIKKIKAATSQELVKAVGTRNANVLLKWIDETKTPS
jgi:excinuclease ABC subunit C